MGLQEIQTSKKKKVYVAFSNTCNKDRGADLRGSVVVAASSVTCLLLFFPLLLKDRSTRCGLIEFRVNNKPVVSSSVATS